LRVYEREGGREEGGREGENAEATRTQNSQSMKERGMEGGREGRTYRVIRIMPVAHICSLGFSTAAISRRLKVEG